MAIAVAARLHAQPAGVERAWCACMLAWVCTPAAFRMALSSRLRPPHRFNTVAYPTFPPPASAGQSVQDGGPGVALHHGPPPVLSWHRFTASLSLLVRSNPRPTAPDHVDEPGPAVDAAVGADSTAGPVHARVGGHAGGRCTAAPRRARTCKPPPVSCLAFFAWPPDLRQKVPHKAGATSPPPLAPPHAQCSQTSLPRAAVPKYHLYHPCSQLDVLGPVQHPAGRLSTRCGGAAEAAYPEAVRQQDRGGPRRGVKKHAASAPSATVFVPPRPTCMLQGSWRLARDPFRPPAFMLMPPCAACCCSQIGRTCVRLEELDLSNNELNTLSPYMGMLPALRSLILDGNPLRTIRRPILDKGTAYLLQYLRDRIPA
eukprot:146845-Chlamydomonas_euryale.AAC.5